MRSRTVLLCIGWGSAALAVQLTLAHLVGICGPEAGTEFSPELFRVRSYRTYHWGPVEFPRYEEVRNGRVADYLVANDIVDPDPERPRWISAFRSPPVWVALLVCIFPGRLSCMLDELEQREERLIEWSEREPELAKVFWTQVVIWAREGKYEEIEALVGFVDEPITEDDVEQRIAAAERWVRDSYHFEDWDNRE